MPRGIGGATAFKMYVAESRHVRQAYMLVPEAAVLEAVKMRQALGTTKPITVEHLWDQIAADMSQKPYKAIGIDLLRDRARIGHEHEITEFLKIMQNTEAMEQAGRDLNEEFHQRQRDEAARQALGPHIAALASTIERNGAAIGIMGEELLPAVESLVQGYQMVNERVAKIAQARRAAARSAELHGIPEAVAAGIATKWPEPWPGTVPYPPPEPSPAPVRRSGPRMG